jgi:hypothetical protein
LFVASVRRRVLGLCLRSRSGRLAHCASASTPDNAKAPGNRGLLCVWDAQGTRNTGREPDRPIPGIGTRALAPARLVAPHVAVPARQHGSRAFDHDCSTDAKALMMSRQNIVASAVGMSCFEYENRWIKEAPEDRMSRTGRLLARQPGAAARAAPLLARFGSQESAESRSGVNPARLQSAVAAMPE